jgi:hypothetical protein
MKNAILKTFTVTLAVALTLSALASCKESHQHEWIDATCTTPKTCKTCQATEGNAKGHTYAEELDGLSCTTDGAIIYTCACGDTYRSEKTALGHD